MNWKDRTIEKIRNFRKDFGKLGFWTVSSLVLPIIGFTAFIGAIYNISPWLREHRMEGVLLFIFSVAILAGLALLPTNTVGVISGWAFGFQLGLISIFAAIGGALAINYFVSKRLAGKDFREMIEAKPKLKAIHRELLKDHFVKTVVIIVLLRLSPGAPFSATNFLMAASGVSIKTFLFGTLIAYIPRTSVTVFVGASLTELDFSHPQEAWLLIVGIASTIAATIMIGVLSRRALNRFMAEVAAQ